MEVISTTIHKSPSFTTNSSNKISEIADKVVLEHHAYHNSSDDDVFTFTDSGDVDTNPDEEELEFEFPVMCRDSNSHRNSTDELISGEQISPLYPVFDRSLISDLDLNLCNGYGYDHTSKTDFKQQTQTSRLSLMKLFDEDRETTSNSSSEADELDGITPETYCVWKPKNTELPRGNNKHKKSNSVSIGNTSNRWKVRDLLKRSYSDDNYKDKDKDLPVLFFIPPVQSNRKNGEKVNNKIGKSTEKKIYKSKIGNVCLPPYLPYREDQLAAFANFTGGPNRK